MKRRAIKLALSLLLLGATINIAVAWVCVVADVRSEWPHWEYWAGPGKSNWPAGAPSGWPSPDQHWWHANIGIRVEGAVRNDWEPEGAGTKINEWFARRIEAGLPCLTCSSTDWHFAPPAGERRTSSSLARGISLPGSFGPYLPLAPLWPGFAINTIIYAAIPWLLFAFPFTVRRWRRIKRGLCPECAYPVGESKVCTECGRPTRSSLDGE